MKSERVKSEKLYHVALSHAETTMKHHFREDGSCYHVAVYDTLDGHFIKGVTHQGYADSSMWSRGQSWAIYGYTMVYRYTHDQRFLDFAQKVTDIYLKRLRETSDDWVPYWDMDIPEVKNEQTTRQLVNSFTRQLELKLFLSLLYGANELVGTTGVFVSTADAAKLGFYVFNVHAFHK